MMMYIAIGVLVLAAIILLIGLYKSIEVWHWAHMLFVFLCFVMAVFAGNTISKSFKVRSAWQLQYAVNKAKFEELEREVTELQFGKPDAVTRDLATNRGIDVALEIELYGRGRVWQGGTVTPEGDDFIVEFSGRQDPDAAEATSTADQLNNGMLVYVFQEVPVGDAKAPKVYLGVMGVKATDGDKVTLEKRQTMDMQESEITKDADGNPSITKTPIFQDIANELKTPSATWTLYEKMPTDVGDEFKRYAGITEDPQRDDKVDIDAYQTEYRAVLTEFLNKQSLNLEEGNPDHDRIYEQVIDRFAFNGMKMSDINDWIKRQENRIANEFDPAAEERFVRLRFNEKSSEIQVDTSTGNVGDSGLFDAQGRAVDSTLWLSPTGDGKVVLQKDQVIIVDPTSARRLKAQENVTDEGEVYIRHLQDYPTVISTLDEQREDIVIRIEKIMDEVKKLKVTTANLQSQETTRSTKRSALTQDTENLEKDVQTITALQNLLQLEVTETKTRINQLHKDINLQHERLKQRSADAFQDTSTTETISQN